MIYDISDNQLKQIYHYFEQVIENSYKNNTSRPHVGYITLVNRDIHINAVNQISLAKLIYLAPHKYELKWNQNVANDPVTNECKNAVKKMLGDILETRN